MTPAGVIALEMRGRGPQRGFVFDPHRLALPCWALSTTRHAVLVTLDRHFDTVIPAHPPGRGWSSEQLDEHARSKLDVRNYDHVLAAMEAGIVSDAIIVARAHPAGCINAPRWIDSHGYSHELVAAPRIDALSHQFGEASASPESRRAAEVLARADQVILDVDLDCFTTPSDADPTTLIPWPEPLIREFLLPRGCDAFWSAVLAKCVALTFAREPWHCGGLIAAGDLFKAAAQVIFKELLATDLP